MTRLTPGVRLPRRSLLTTAAALAVAQVALPAGALEQTTGGDAPARGRARPGDFDFLTGEWQIRHRRLVDGQWDAFDGEASCWSILGGRAHIEELRIPARDFAGSGIRLLDMAKALWADYWVNAKSGVLNLPPALGSFVDGAGVFESADTDQGQPIIVRGVWDRITGDGHRWHQSLSRDAGASWEMNWEMFWQRKTS